MSRADGGSGVEGAGGVPTRGEPGRRPPAGGAGDDGASYRPSEVAALCGVSVDTVRRWTDSGELPARRGPRGQRTIDGEDLAEFLRRRRPAGFDGPVGGQSARNRFPGVVTDVEIDGLVAQVEIQAGPHRVVSLMTAEAARQLGLRPGQRAVAVVKATTVVVELPA